MSALKEIEKAVLEAAELDEAVRRDNEMETGQVQALSPEEFRRRVEAARKR